MRQHVVFAIALSILVCAATPGLTQTAADAAAVQTPKLVPAISTTPPSRSERTAGRVRMMGAEFSRGTHGGKQMSSGLNELPTGGFELTASRRPRYQSAQSVSGMP